MAQAIELWHALCRKSQLVSRAQRFRGIKGRQTSIFQPKSCPRPHRLQMLLSETVQFVIFIEPNFGVAKELTVQVIIWFVEDTGAGPLTSIARIESIIMR